MKVVLQAKTGSKEVLFEVSAVPIILGRGDKALVVLPDTNCSRNHCRFFVRDGGLWVEDMQSKNGTFVNAIKTSKKQIFLNDKINIGSTEIRIPTHKNKPEIIKMLQAQSAVTRDEPILTVETNPLIDELRHNPLKALKTVQDGTAVINKKKLMENKLFKDAFVEHKRANPKLKQLWRFKVAKVFDTISPILALALPHTLIFIIGIKTRGTITTTVVSLMLAGIFWYWNKKFPTKTLGRKLLGIWED